jgi:hypothetical protein
VSWTNSGLEATSKLGDEASASRHAVGGWEVSSFAPGVAVPALRLL